MTMHMLDMYDSGWCWKVYYNHLCNGGPKESLLPYCFDIEDLQERASVIIDRVTIVSWEVQP